MQRPGQSVFPAEAKTRIVAITALARQLTQLIAQEIAALRAKNAGALAASEPEKTRLMALYQREHAGLKKLGLNPKTIPAPVAAELRAAALALDEALKLQARLLQRLRHVTEGLVKAVAEEVSRKRGQAATYARPFGARPMQKAPQAASALTLNAVV